MYTTMMPFFVILFTRLSGIIHVLYEAMQVFTDDRISDDLIPDMPSKQISSEEVQMAIALTEYFQAQRQAYDKVLC